jgi:hypothetical protein
MAGEQCREHVGCRHQQYTIFFVNWYGRSDFKFHVYTKTGEPDPETGTDFGLRDSRKLIAWGGTTPDDEETGLGSLHRIWFYDLSAGPESWTDNWNVDDADLDSSGVTDYRMPPVWEYGNIGAYRPFDDLSGDLGKVARYVAIDLLFTSSPLSAAISAPLIPSDIELDINVPDRPNGVALDYLTALLTSELNELQPPTTSLPRRSHPLTPVFKWSGFSTYICFGNCRFGRLPILFSGLIIQSGRCIYEN